MTTRNAAWHDRMYNNRALVPDFAEHFERWKNASVQARQQRPCVLDVAYGDGPNETLDIFPASRPGAPVVVFIHGGYWRSLDKADHSFVAPPLLDMGAAWWWSTTRCAPAPTACRSRFRTSRCNAPGPWPGSGATSASMPATATTFL